MTNKPLDNKKPLPRISAALVNRVNDTTISDGLDKAITDELNQKISIISDGTKVK